MAHVVIMVPSFGKGAENFYQAALGLKRDFYGPNTTIVKVRAVLPKDWWNLEEMLDLWELIGEKDRAEVIKRLKNYKGRVEHPLILRTDKGKPFHFGEPKSCRSFITLSHAAEGDGPIFYDHHKTHGFQPWGTGSLPRSSRRHRAGPASRPRQLQGASPARPARGVLAVQPSVPWVATSNRCRRSAGWAAGRRAPDDSGVATERQHVGAGCQQPVLDEAVEVTGSSPGPAVEQVVHGRVPEPVPLEVVTHPGEEDLVSEPSGRLSQHVGAAGVGDAVEVLQGGQRVHGSVARDRMGGRTLVGGQAPHPAGVGLVHPGVVVRRRGRGDVVADVLGERLVEPEVVPTMPGSPGCRTTGAPSRERSEPRGRPHAPPGCWAGRRATGPGW